MICPLADAQQLTAGTPPKPWRLSRTFPAGGAVACGWTTNDDAILLISDNAYSVYKIETGEEVLINFDHNDLYDGYTKDDVHFDVKELGQTVNIFGFRAGGGNRVSSSTDWVVEVIYPWWPRAMVILTRVFFIRYAIESDLNPVASWLACGFSVSGKHFAILGNEGVEIFSYR